MVPECLENTLNLKIALNEAERFRKTFVYMPDEYEMDPEVAFLDSQIEDLQKQIAAQEKKAEKIYALLRVRDYRAYMCALLHYGKGLTWQDVADNIGGTSESTRMQAYRAFDRLKKEGFINK